MLQIFFPSYPIVTNVACDAFACYTFEDAASYLVADVSIVCNSAEHRTARGIAWLINLHLNCPQHPQRPAPEDKSTRTAGCAGSRVGPPTATSREDMRATPLLHWEVSLQGCWQMGTVDMVTKASCHGRPSSISSSPLSSLSSSSSLSSLSPP